MKNLLKKLHIVPTHADEPSAGSAGAGAGSGDASDSSSSASSSPLKSAAAGGGGDQKPLTTLTGWLDSVANKHSSATATTPSSSSSSSSSSVAVVPRAERRDGPGTASPPDGVARRESPESGVAAAAPAAAELGLEPEEMDEEYQIQLALELSAREDPEAVQIEAVKRISLGAACDPENGPAGILAYRYWNYSALGYDDKILDGFYDICNISAESRSMKFPSLVDLQQVPLSGSINWEVVLVNRTEDASLLELEQKALLLADEIRAGSSDISGSVLVQNVAYLVANFMGGEVCDPESTSRSYQNLCSCLKASIGSTILPLGHLTIGLARQRALLFKVLADSLEIPCRLTKGKEYTGSDDGALNIIKLNDGREYIVDLMAEPGTLIPSDGAGMSNETEEAICVEYPSISDANFTHLADTGVSTSANCYPEYEQFDRRAMFGSSRTSDVRGTVEIQDNNGSSPISCHNYSEENVNNSSDSKSSSSVAVRKSFESSGKPNHPYAIARSPSSTEGINSPAVCMMKVKDVSEYMINAAKENPQLAQKLHDVLLESGVIAPPSLFTDIYNEKPATPIAEDVKPIEDKMTKKPIKNELKHKVKTDWGHGPSLPHLPIHNGQQKANLPRPQLEPSKPVDRLKPPLSVDNQDATRNSSMSDVSDIQLPETQLQLIRNMPVAAAAATAAVVASSMVVAAAKSNADMNLEVAATATAAAVVATTAAVSRQYEHSDLAYVPVVLGCGDATSSTENNDNALVSKQQMTDEGHDGSLKKKDAFQVNQESERTSDKSTGTESIKSESALDDVAEFEIQWEDITLGERVGLGSFGEVYHGDWHGTEVAVKRFLHQDISNDALEEFRSEVRIMKRMRHPNVVLFMGAVTRVPNLSIVTEFLPRGSLFRLIHRPNNQLDERRRLRMALDVARGMNYLHNCSPIIVHRDLKSPNLLVDKNWVVKVCDFGLSRMKHNTFLSSRSTAGTAEWMAPEVLKNEPSDEKCDVFSFGVILWELCTLQQPWEGMNPMQVVGAVGFQDRRLDIPSGTDPVIADIINRCWQIDPKMRPSFSEIMAALKTLHKSMISTQGLRPKNS